jgi:hypothetical protein
VARLAEIIHNSGSSHVVMVDDIRAAILDGHPQSMIHDGPSRAGVNLATGVSILN